MKIKQDVLLFKTGKPLRVQTTERRAQQVSERMLN